MTVNDDIFDKDEDKKLFSTVLVMVYNFSILRYMVLVPPCVLCPGIFQILRAPKCQSQMTKLVDLVHW